MFSQESSNCYGQPNQTIFRRPIETKRLCFGTKKYSVTKLCYKIQELEFKCCVLMDPLIRSTSIQEKPSCRLLKSIVTNTERNILQQGPVHAIGLLIDCSLVLVQAFVAHLKIHLTFWDRFKRRQFGNSVKYFHMLIYKLIPEMSNMVVDKVMDFLQVERLWSVQFICCEILMALLECDMPPSKILSKLLTYVEEQLAADNVKQARNVAQVLNKIICEKFWKNQTAVDCNQLIRLYYKSICEIDVTKPYFQMRRGFAVCIVRFCEVLPNSELMILIRIMFGLCFGSDLLPDAMTDFSHTLETAILYADVETISEALEPNILKHALNAIVSKNRHISKIGSRLLARLVDRHRNFGEFITPRIFLPNNYYNINVSVYREQDKELFQRFRLNIEDSILAALKNHQNAYNIETIFAVLCTMLVESPCGYTACQVISILLQLQDFAIAKTENTVSTETNQMHGMVLSVMTLITWVHRASTLSLYVQRILNRRGDYAPHLNPPIKLVYQYASHHVQWNEPSFFFDFWEIRYGLWKRFRSHELQMPYRDEKATIRKFYHLGPRDGNKSDRIKDELITSNLVRESIDSVFF